MVQSGTFHHQLTIRRRRSQRVPSLYYAVLFLSPGRHVSEHCPTNSSLPWTGSTLCPQRNEQITALNVHSWQILVGCPFFPYSGWTSCLNFVLGQKRSDTSLWNMFNLFFLFTRSPVRDVMTVPSVSIVVNYFRSVRSSSCAEHRRNANAIQTFNLKLS